MMLGILCNEFEVAVVTDSGGNVKTVLATEIPGDSCDKFFVYDETAYKWDDGVGIVIKGGVEVLLSWDVRVESGLLE